MQEILRARTESSKTFDLGSGRRRLESHIGAIHYKNDYATDKDWKDIDLTWEGNHITKAPYELTRDGNKLTFKDKKTGEVSTIELLSVKPVGIPFEIIPEFSAVRFQHILPNDKIPFEAKFKIEGKAPFTRAFDDEGELELETSLVDGILTEKLSQVKDRDTGQVRPAKGNIRIDPTWQVGASTDDAYKRLVPSYWSLTEVFRAGAYDASNYQYGSGARFINITIPQGSTISSANLIVTEFYAGGESGATCNTRISAEDVDDAITFANDSAAFSARWAARTTARVNWDSIGAWVQNVEYTSPEIKTVIQEIVDRVGWASGNDIVIFWDDYEDRSTHANSAFRTGFSYNGSTTKAPKLVIEYAVAQTVGGGTITPAGVLGRNIFKAVGGGTITPAGVLGRNIFKAVGGGTITPSGILARKIAIAIGAGAITPAGALSYLRKRYRNIASFTGRDLSDDNVRNLKDFTGRDLK